MTPEGRVKKLITSYLEDLKERLTCGDNPAMYYSMFVPTGYGRRNSLDYTICLWGHFIGIEAKAPGEDLTLNQRHTCRDLYWSGATVFIVSGSEGLEAFKRWVDRNADRLAKN